MLDNDRKKWETCYLCGCPNHKNNPCTNQDNPVHHSKCSCGHEGHWTKKLLDEAYKVVLVDMGMIEMMEQFEKSKKVED